MTLSQMEQNESRRMSCLQDAFVNWSAFITNLTLNRQYDVRNLAENMARIEPTQDLQQFMRHVLDTHPILPPAPPSTYYRRISVSLKLPNEAKKVEFDYDPKTEDLSVFVRDVVDSLSLGRDREDLIVTAIRSKLAHLNKQRDQSQQRRESVSTSISSMTPNAD